MITRIEFERRAQQLVDRHAISNPPIDVDLIAQHEGIEVVASRSAGLESGFAFQDGQRRVIGINTRESRRRQRCTIAHEIGHLDLHDDRPLTVDQTVRVHKRDEVSSMATDRQEIEANGFAAALLMPQTMVETAMGEYLRSGAGASRDGLITALARVFDVSSEAMGYRLINLGMLSP